MSLPSADVGGVPLRRRSVYGLPAHYLVCAFGLYLLATQQLGRFADDPGVGWHLKTGEWILQHRAVPRFDPFLAGESRPWVADQWLSDVALALLYRLGSWPALYLVLAFVFAFSFLILLFNSVIRSRVGRLSASVAVLIAMKMSFVHFILRPTLIGMVMFLITLAEIQRPASKRQFITLPTAFFLWANLHPSFVIGLELAVLSCVASLVKESGWKKSVVRWGLLLMASASATLINPYGISLHRSILELGGSSFFMMHHEEWRPLNFLRIEGQLVALTAMFVVIGFAVQRTRRKVAEVIPASILLLQAARMLRMVPYYAVAVATPLGRAFGDILRGTAVDQIFPSGLGRRLVTRASRFERLNRRPSTLGFTVLFLAIVVPHVILMQTGPRATEFPYGAMNELARFSEAGGVVSTPDWGGFITLQAYPRLRPYLDDRNTLVGENQYRRFYEALESDDTWEIYVHNRKPAFIILPSDFRIVDTMKRNGNYRLLFEDKVATVFRMRT